MDCFVVSKTDRIAKKGTYEQEYKYLEGLIQKVFSKQKEYTTQNLKDWYGIEKVYRGGELYEGKLTLKGVILDDMSEGVEIKHFKEDEVAEEMAKCKDIPTQKEQKKPATPTTEKPFDVEKYYDGTLFKQMMDRLTVYYPIFQGITFVSLQDKRLHIAFPSKTILREIKESEKFYTSLKENIQKNFGNDITIIPLTPQVLEETSTPPKQMQKNTKLGSTPEATPSENLVREDSDSVNEINETTQQGQAEENKEQPSLKKQLKSFKDDDKYQEFKRKNTVRVHNGESEESGDKEKRVEGTHRRNGGNVEESETDDYKKSSFTHRSLNTISGNRNREKPKSFADISKSLGYSREPRQEEKLAG